jgi:hypothetical protein
VEERIIELQAWKRGQIERVVRASGEPGPEPAGGGAGGRAGGGAPPGRAAPAARLSRADILTLLAPELRNRAARRRGRGRRA